MRLPIARIVAAAAAALLLTGAGGFAALSATTRFLEPKATGRSLKPGVTAATVSALSQQVRAHGNDILSTIGGLTPVPASIQVGPVGCEEDSVSVPLPNPGAYQVTGGWLAAVGPGKPNPPQVLEDAWKTKPYATHRAGYSRARQYVVVVKATDTGSGFHFMAAFYYDDANTGGADFTSVKITVASPCQWPADRRFPSNAT